MYAVITQLLLVQERSAEKAVMPESNKVTSRDKETCDVLDRIQEEKEREEAGGGGEGRRVISRCVRSIAPLRKPS